MQMLVGTAARALDAVHPGWIAAAALAVITLLFLAHQHRQRRVYHRLAQRLDELEEALAVRGSAERTAPATSPAASEPETEAAGHPRPTPTRDVLAGMTARVRRLLSGEASPGRALAEQAIVRVHDQLHEGVTVDSLAAALHVSPRTLQRGLSHALGCTPRQLILAVRMREARRLLLAEGCLVKEVAARLGFTDQHHFTHCFTTFYHVAPSRLRRQAASGSANGDDG